MGKRVLICVMVIALLASVTGCASIFYPSRVGQRTHGTVDVGMLVLDIFLTGLVGIVVDLITGAIYLPASYCVPSGELGEAFNPGDGIEQLDTITLPQTGVVEFRLPVRAASGTGHEIALMVLTDGGKTAACAEAAFTGSADWHQISSKIDISAGDATGGVMRVMIDGNLISELPVKFVRSTR